MGINLTPSTGSLDKENADKVMAILQELNKMGKTIIMVTHNEEYKAAATMNVELKRPDSDNR